MVVQLSIFLIYLLIHSSHDLLIREWRTSRLFSHSALKKYGSHGHHIFRVQNSTWADLSLTNLSVPHPSTSLSGKWLSSVETLSQTIA